MIAGHGLRQTSFHAIEALVHSPAHRSLGLRSHFGDDTLGYFTERLDPAPTRLALVTALQRAKRNKAFDASPRIGLALDGTTVGHCHGSGCARCRPYRNAGKEIIGYRHHLALITVVGTGPSLPFDVEPYGSGNSEYAAGQRLSRRAMPALGTRFADYLVVDAGFATSTFLHTAAVARRFGACRPSRVITEGTDRVELWDADDFDPLGDTGLGDGSRRALPPDQARRDRRGSGMADEHPHAEGQLPGRVPHGQKPMGGRERRLQRL